MFGHMAYIIHTHISSEIPYFNPSFVMQTAECRHAWRFSGFGQLPRSASQRIIHLSGLCTQGTYSLNPSSEFVHSKKIRKKQGCKCLHIINFLHTLLHSKDLEFFPFHHGPMKSLVRGRELTGFPFAHRVIIHP